MLYPIVGDAYGDSNDELHLIDKENFSLARFQISRKHLRSFFLDTLRLHVTGGRGGAGLPHYGGLGGAGGNVYFVAKENITLKDVATKLKVEQIHADPGTDSSKRGIIGTPGQDKIISVPCGVGVYNENNVLLGIIS